MKKCIDLQEEAFRAVYSNRASNAKNSFLYMDKNKGYIKLMGCSLEASSHPDSSDVLMVKAIDAFERNPTQYGLPVVLGSMTLFDCSNGLPICFMDAAYTTALRTGAAGGLATKLGARRDSRSVGVIGSGSTAGFTTKAIIELMPQIERVKVFSRNPHHRSNLCKKISTRDGPRCEPVDSAEEALKDVDIIVTGTNSSTPILFPNMITKGQHINAMGVKTEIDPKVFGMSKIIADSTEVACNDGKTSVAIKAHVVTQSDVYSDIGEILEGKKAGRNSPDDITLFDSSGVAAQDAVLAGFLYQEARRKKVGTKVSMFEGLSELLMP